MYYTTEEKETMLSFATWISDNHLQKNDKGLWYSDVHSYDHFTDEDLIHLYTTNPFRINNSLNEWEIPFDEVKNFKPLVVNKYLYPLFDYAPYWKNDKAFWGKMKSTYKVGQVVYIKPENRIGVVLGIIDEVRGELRTDASGMVSYNDLEVYIPKKHMDAVAHTALKSALKLFGDN